MNKKIKSTDEKKVKNKKSHGRPTIKTQEILNRVCELTATTMHSMRKLTELYPELPSFETLCQWRLHDRSFSDQYAESKRIQQDLIVEELEKPFDDVLMYRDSEGNSRTDGGSVMLERARVDTRKWVASKLAPKVYGDRKLLEEKEKENDALRREIAELRVRLDEKYKRDY